MFTEAALQKEDVMEVSCSGHLLETSVFKKYPLSDYMSAAII